MLKAFCRVAPTVRLSFFAIFPAFVFFGAVTARSPASPELRGCRMTMKSTLKSNVLRSGVLT
jgi:hypothetical protein